MGKANWMRVLLGGLLAGIAINVFGFSALAIFLRKQWNPALEILNPAFHEVECSSAA